MKKRLLPLFFFWNGCAFALALVAPVKWVAPFAAALTAAAGLNGASVLVLPGALIGCLAGAGGAGAAVACLTACAGAECHRLLRRGRDSFVCLWAFFCCLIPALIRYAARGTYDLLTSAAVSLVALAAAPVWTPLFARDLITRPVLSADERLSLHFLGAGVICGLARLHAPLGLFAAGFFVLLSAGEGVLCACAAAFPAGLALILGGAEALPAALLLVAAGAAGLGRGVGRWAQALLFLTALPLLAYFGWDGHLLALFLPSVLFPLLPERFCAGFCRRFYAHAALRTPPYRLLAARRHVPVPGRHISGDTGAIDYLPDNRVLLILADGMGTGPGARRLSDRAVREARRVLRASLDAPTAYRAINRLLFSGENAFSTLETCVIDLERGLAAFHKCGSETAWVVRGRHIKRLRGSALPLGIVPEAPPSALHLQLQPGDTVFLATDGLISALGGESGTERALLSLIHHSPADICARMLTIAQKSVRAHPDDMSALCARLVRRETENAENAA